MLNSQHHTAPSGQAIACASTLPVCPLVAAVPKSLHTHPKAVSLNRGTFIFLLVRYSFQSNKAQATGVRNCFFIEALPASNSGMLIFYKAIIPTLQNQPFIITLQKIERCFCTLRKQRF